MSALTWARCPYCRGPLAREPHALRCPQGHSFDIARQGYVNLLGRAAPANADTAAMLDARARFLNSGHFDPIAEAVAEAAIGERIVEVGAGTAFYLARVLDRHLDADGLATDVSVAAAKRAARAHPRVSAVVADTWAGLPLPDDCVDTIVCVFAPRNFDDFARILRPGGRLVVVQPLPSHLASLRSAYGLLGVAPDKVDRLAGALRTWDVLGHQQFAFHISLSADGVRDLIEMGPNAFHELPTSVGPASTEVAVELVTATRPLAPATSSSP